jgi:phosphopantothenoylcysteine synthetase/decarboxylase
MSVLVTAGNTQVPIDRVRCLTNVFTGRTGAAVALEAYRRGRRVTLLTSHPETVADLQGQVNLEEERWRVGTYRTFDDLQRLMEHEVRTGDYDVVIHSAAVSDYLAGGVFVPADGTRFDAQRTTWRAEPGHEAALSDRAAGKIKSDEPELWLRLVRAPKLVDSVRREWGFRGTLVKFKLEVGAGEEQLLAIAEKSRLGSGADLMVANTLEGAAEWAYVGPIAGGYVRVARGDLPGQLLDAIEKR